jgi:hypothetical protein
MYRAVVGLAFLSPIVRLDGQTTRWCICKFSLEGVAIVAEKACLLSEHGSASISDVERIKAVR